MARSSTTFKPDHKGTGGRPKGSLNKLTRDAREFAREIIRNRRYLKSLLRRLISGRAPHMEPLIFHYAYGRPVDMKAALRLPPPPNPKQERWDKLSTEEKIRDLEETKRSTEKFIATLKRHLAREQGLTEVGAGQEGRMLGATSPPERPGGQVPPVGSLTRT